MADANFNAWLAQGNTAINANTRATEAWNRIQRNPTSITLVRGQTTLSAQPVRVEWDNATSSASELQGEGAGRSSRRYGVVFGVQNHPTVTDTDIQRGDKCVLNGQQYRVVETVTPPGEVQATIEVLS